MPDHVVAMRREASSGRPEHSVLHRVPAPIKLIVLIVFAITVIATPRDWFVAFAVYAFLVAVALAATRVRPRTVIRRLSIELPFLVFALLLPSIALGPRVEVLGLPLAVEGVWAAWALLAKSTLTVLASIALVASTEPRRIVVALGQLGLPRQLTAIMSFMVRYLDIIVEEQRRMQIARAARGFGVRGPRDWRVLALSIGALFIRAHGRGERVHLAMLARGHDERARESVGAGPS